MNLKKKQIAILGSTGSIGTQALNVIAQHRDLFEVNLLTANVNVDLLIKQACLFLPDTVVIANQSYYLQLKEALSHLPIKVYAGSESICQAVRAEDIDIVLTAMVGFSGLAPTIAALESGKAIALSNKETLVVAGELIKNLALKHKSPILPVDSEHSAIFQSLMGEGENNISKIFLTASGGPFLGKTRKELEHVTAKQALNHPNWSMGYKVTIDSASLMNKGLEAIEAKWLFDVSMEAIEVVVHPQSIIHSMVEFEDASVKAQMGMPDMRIPILLAFSYPFRLKSDFPRLSFSKIKQLTFEEPDIDTFENLKIAYWSAEKGGNFPCIMNAANEVAVFAFLQEKIGFLQMSDIIEKTMQKVSFVKHPTYEDYMYTDLEARRIAKSLIKI